MQIHDSKDVTFEKILLGHIFTHIQDPKGRLAAIMAMHDSAALHNCTPAAFFNTYDRVSLPIIANGLKDSFQNKDDIEWLNILKVFDQSTLENSWNSMSRNIKTGFAKVFTNEPIQFYKILDLSFSDRDSRVRESALDYFIKDISIFRKELIEATKDREPHIRETALEALLNDPLVENSIFIHALSDRDDGVKLNGIRKILQHPDLYHQQLVSLASDPNYILQWKAIEGLAADSGKGREFLENYIMRNDDDDWSANVAWEYLKSANNLRKKFLFKCLFHKDKAFREMAFNTLSSFFSIEI